MTGNTVGIIDLGTNTALLLIAQINPYGKITILTDEYALVGLGRGVDSTRRINSKAMDRACGQLKIYANTAENFGVTNLIAWGTSAVRDATNKDELKKSLFNIYNSSPRFKSFRRGKIHIFWCKLWFKVITPTRSY